VAFQNWTRKFCTTLSEMRASHLTQCCCLGTDHGKWQGKKGETWKWKMFLGSIWLAIQLIRKEDYWTVSDSPDYCLGHQYTIFRVAVLRKSVPVHCARDWPWHGILSLKFSCGWGKRFDCCTVLQLRASHSEDLCDCVALLYGYRAMEKSNESTAMQSSPPQPPLRPEPYDESIDQKSTSIIIRLHEDGILASLVLQLPTNCCIRFIFQS